MRVHHLAVVFSIPRNSRQAFPSYRGAVLELAPSASVRASCVLC
jgi:hypothetical protein